MAIGTRRKTLDYPHQSVALTDALIRIDGQDYFAQLGIRASTVTIYNVTISNDNWTAITTGLTNVLGWRLSERKGADFYFAFVAAPSTYATAFGWVAEQTEITAIYAKRTGSANITLELCVWTP